MRRRKRPTVSGRRYTGFDGEATGEHPALSAFRRCIKARFPYTMNLGTYAVRPMRGKTTPSVHGTGRAWDCGWDGDYQRRAIPLIDFVVGHADGYGVEMVLDYFEGFGRGWRCDRGVWLVYDRPTLTGAPGGRWTHIEIAPTMTPQQILDYDGTVPR
jgi:hypothetical protein